MSRKGNCYDNAPMESFWGTLKSELVHHRHYITREEAIKDITEYIEVFYNRERRQERLGYLSPAAYVRKFYSQPGCGMRRKFSCPLLTSDANKLITAKEAAGLVKSGDVVVFPLFLQPKDIGDEIAKRKDELRLSTN